MVNVQRWITQFISKQSWQENVERYLKMGPQNEFQVGHDSAHSERAHPLQVLDPGATGQASAECIISSTNNALFVEVHQSR